MPQVPARALELPGGPVASARLEDVLGLLVVEVEPAAEVDDLGGEVAVDRGPRGPIGHLDRHLGGTLPGDARDDGAVSLEFVAHDLAPSFWVPARSSRGP